MPVTGVPTGLVMTITYSNRPPSGQTSFSELRQTAAATLRAQGRSQSAGRLDPLQSLSSDVAYACIAANQLVILNGAPQYTFALPSGFDTTGVAYYAAIFSNGAWVSNYGGPAAAVARPSAVSVAMAGRFGFSIPANGKVCVALYARSTAAAEPPPATSGTLAIDASTLHFASSATQAVGATESGYTGTFSATSANTGVATVAVGAAGAASGQFVVTPVGIGTTTVTITGGTATATFAVIVTALTPAGSGPTVIASPVAVSSAGLDIGPGVVETLAVGGSAGVFTATTTCGTGSVATLTGSPGTTFTLSALNVGTCAITIADAAGQTTTIPEIVSGATIPVI